MSYYERVDSRLPSPPPPPSRPSCIAFDGHFTSLCFRGVHLHNCSDAAHSGFYESLLDDNPLPLRFIGSALAATRRGHHFMLKVEKPKEHDLHAQIWSAHVPGVVPMLATCTINTEGGLAKVLLMPWINASACSIALSGYDARHRTDLLHDAVGFVFGMLLHSEAVDVDRWIGWPPGSMDKNVLCSSPRQQRRVGECTRDRTHCHSSPLLHHDFDAASTELSHTDKVHTMAFAAVFWPALIMDALQQPESNSSWWQVARAAVATTCTAKAGTWSSRAPRAVQAADALCRWSSQCVQAEAALPRHSHEQHERGAQLLQLAMSRTTRC